ncbi:hypothetical protein PNEG_02387 [Pneumocystis murina B123]|uniref:HIT-type domain-containing protein n=1 Tax=Pneumocystis murina (strain B123) TaxID=1069680 RepID=M7P6E8_PNEMU|nr:hypothetical protein PNEG_02387 [Pneumocystis murina B123]EMR09445.1 hypothetical protein PNEG_02387 [Pneumocystis murina B123]
MPFVSSVENSILNRKKRPTDRTKIVIIDPSVQIKHINRHLVELERDNYNDVKIELTKNEEIRTKKSNANVRKILTSRKTFAMHLDEAGANTGYHLAAVGPSNRPPIRLCIICGYWGNYRCNKCGERYCSKSCEIAHLETRCMKTYS